MVHVPDEAYTQYITKFSQFVQTIESVYSNILVCISKYFRQYFSVYTLHMYGIYTNDTLYIKIF